MCVLAQMRFDLHQTYKRLSYGGIISVGIWSIRLSVMVTNHVYSLQNQMGKDICWSHVVSCSYLQMAADSVTVDKKPINVS